MSATHWVTTEQPRTAGWRQKDCSTGGVLCTRTESQGIAVIPLLALLIFRFSHTVGLKAPKTHTQSQTWYVGPSYCQRAVSGSLWPRRVPAPPLIKRLLRFRGTLCCVTAAQRDASAKPPHSPDSSLTPPCRSTHPATHLPRRLVHCTAL
jgi:hypothetical protein